jgi:hypothetical protein
MLNMRFILAAMNARGLNMNVGKKKERNVKMQYSVKELKKELLDLEFLIESLSLNG